MPTYEYRCVDGHQFEAVQRMIDPPLETCEVCGKPVRRVLFPPPIHFKGSGFYATDYGKGGKAKPPGKDEGSSSDKSGDSSSSNGSGDSAPAKSGDKSGKGDKSDKAPATSSSGDKKPASSPSSS